MKQRNSLLRRTPLKRRTRIRQRRATLRRSGRVRDTDYLRAVKGLPCLLAWDAPGPGGCEGRVEADHAGARPLGRKADDDTAIPLCRKHHRERTDYRGAFDGFNSGLMRVWCDTAIAETRARLTRREGAV